MTYNEIIQQVGKRILKHIYYVNNGTTTYVNDDNVGKIKLTQKADLIGTAIKGCEISVKEQLLGQVYVQVVATYQTYSQTKTYGPYNIKEEKYDAKQKTYDYILYDNLIKTMVDYFPLEDVLDNNNTPLITFPCTVYQYFTALNTYMNFTTNISSLPNGSQVLNSDIYKDINYTIRDIYDDISVANGVLTYLDGTVVKKTTFGGNTITINDDILKNQNIDFRKHYGPINSIVLSRSADSDKIYIKDDESIAEYGLCEFKISDNIMLNENNRDQYLPAIATQLFGIEYDIYDTELVGYGDINLLDTVNFTTGSNTYLSYIFNDEIVLTSGYKQTIYNEEPEESETDYKVADTTDRRINNVSLIVNKQEQEIKSLAEKVVDVSNTINGIGSVTLVNAHEGILHRLEIVGNLNLLYPEDTLYPSNTLYPLDTYLLVDSDRYKLDIDYLTYTDSEHYDKYVYEDGKQWIERINGTVVEKEDIEINVKQNSVIRLEGFNIPLKVIYLLENIYTDTFATQVQVNSEIKQTADEINLEVSKKVNEDEIVSTINQSAEQIKIQANKIALEGYTTINDGFSIDSGGNMIANNGTFNGTINGGEVRITDDYTENNPYIEVGDVLETNVSVRMWNGNVVAYDYTGTSYPRIRTETIDGYAELLGPNCRAFAFENISLEDKKKNFEKLDNAINILNKGDIYTYNWKTEDDNDKKHFGFVIGDKYKTPKEVLSKSKEAIDQYAMASILWQVCKEQQKEIESLKEMIKNGVR